jgi:sugar fermentation stimulation protein A
MKLPPLIPGRLIKRYKRFLADIELADGSLVTAHCPNSGSMLGCNLPGSPVMLSVSPNPNRKLAHTWELVQVDGYWVGLNTMLPNRLAEEAILDGTIAELQGYPRLRREVPYGSERSRIDILLEGDQGRCFVEVKNVTLVEHGRALFPDAVTERGQKHLRELMEVVRNGDRGVILFTVQRGDGVAVAPADAIDPAYGRLLRQAVTQGVEALAYRALVAPHEIRLTQSLPVELD